MDNTLDNWTILGCGALGGVLAGMLAQARFLFTLDASLPKMNATTKMV